MMTHFVSLNFFLLRHASASFRKSFFKWNSFKREIIFTVSHNIYFSLDNYCLHFCHCNKVWVICFTACLVEDSEWVINHSTFVDKFLINYFSYNATRLSFAFNKINSYDYSPKWLASSFIIMRSRDGKIRLWLESFTLQTCKSLELS